LDLKNIETFPLFRIMDILKQQATMAQPKLFANLKEVIEDVSETVHCPTIHALVAEMAGMHI
jgi:hypothetical protein